MTKTNFNSFPILKTERLILRQLKLEDENELFVLRSDEEILKYIDSPRAKTKKDVRDFIVKINHGVIQNEWIYWAISLKGSPQLIGTICLWNISWEKSTAETGFVLLPEFQGKGIMQEALTAVIEYGFQHMQLNAIEAYTHPNNINSIKLLERNNFIWMKYLRENNTLNGKIIDSLYVLKKRYHQSPQPY